MPVLMFFIGLIVGLIVASVAWFLGVALWASNSIFGTLKSMPNDDGGDPYLYLDMDEHPDKLSGRKWVLFAVDMRHHTPQE